MYNGMLDILFDKVIFRSKVLISLNVATVPYYFSFNLSQIGSFLKQKKKLFCHLGQKGSTNFKVA